VQVSALKGFKCNPILRELANCVCQEFAAAKVPIRELRITLTPQVDVSGVASATLTGDCKTLEVGPELEEPVERGTLELSVRAEGKADALNAAITTAMTHTWVAFPAVFAKLTHCEHFGEALTPTRLVC
jgi:hypothetical protein